MPEIPNDGSPYEYRRMCAVCHTRLNRRVSPEGKTTYIHGRGSDHEPVPVMEPDEQDIILVCDFCLEPHPTWDFGCENFIDQGTVTPDPTQDVGASLGDWSACDTCKDLIVAGEWADLADRSIAGQIKYNPQVAAAYKASPALMLVNKIGMRNLHQQFNKARTGPPRPIQEATWIAAEFSRVLGVDNDTAVPHHLPKPPQENPG